MGGLEEILNKDNTVVVIVDSMFVNHLRLETLKKSPLVKCYGLFVDIHCVQFCLRGIFTLKISRNHFISESEVRAFSWKKEAFIKNIKTIMVKLQFNCLV